MAEPFLTADQVAERWRPLTPAETQAVGDILTACATAIRDAFTEAGYPEFPVDREDAARVVTLDVVKVHFTTGPYAGHSTYTRVEGPRTKAGTFAGAAGRVDLTDWHRQLLGLPIHAMPRGNFPRGDY